ncbi:MAG: cytochrome-c oxidase [Candidatus Cloacimonadota bacterium]|nr:MAG: cytochrome-c oxidase [Candidatus Cloacimonadota bacterium]
MYKKLSFIFILQLLNTMLFSVEIGLKNPEKKVKKVGVFEKLGVTIPLDLSFTNHDGKKVVLREVIDKPTILNFVYYRCPGICSPLLTSLTETIDRMDNKPGEDYQILTISINHEENIELALRKRNNYLSEMKTFIASDTWRWMIGDQKTIETITQATGFHFKKEGSEFAHAGSLIILSPKGKITRYLTGIEFLPFDLQMALLEASDGKVGPTIARILKFCFSYDPKGRKYVFNLLKVIGVVTTLWMIFFVLFLTFGKKKKRS